MGSCISGGGGNINVIHDFWFLGKGDEGYTKLLLFLLLTYLCSVFIFIKQYSDSLCFVPFLAENYESYALLVIIKIY